MTPGEARRFRRDALEAIVEILKTEPNGYVSYQRLPNAIHWIQPAVLAQLEILEHEGRIQLSRTMDPSEWSARITPLGRKSLEVSEEEWNMSNKSVVNSNTMNITGSTLGNAAQMAGSHGSTITQSTTSNDLKEVHEAIDRLLATVKASPAIDADTKQDAQIEGDQLKGELTKSKPNPDRLKASLEWFKALTGAVEVIPKVAEVWEKVKIYLPGVS